MALSWCNHCEEHTATETEDKTGYECCTQCGKVLNEGKFVSSTFEKTADGQSRFAGTNMRSVDSFSVSRERTLERSRNEIKDIIYHLRIGGGDSIINQAHRLYVLALEHGFTKGRRVSHVSAACVYIVCRIEKRAYLLIDFTDYLQTNVYVLGAVYLQLIQVLYLECHPSQRLLDPSLFIHRFTQCLFGKKNPEVSETALRIIARMKRDWMQTGRKPSGLCGAALYISALSHGRKFSKSDIANVVHVCEATLTKRLIEFENTESGCLTVEEFLAKADELDQAFDLDQLATAGTVLCKHKDEPHCAHGLCKECYAEFIEISGGLQGGAEPPSFQRAERLRMENEKEMEKSIEPYVGTPQHDLENSPTHCEKEAKFSAEVESDAFGDELPAREECEASGDMYNTADGVEESLSDIEDIEVDGYLHNEEETHYKTIIWEELNREYLEEQAAKLAATGNGDDSAGPNKPRKERKRRHIEDAKNSTPAEATSMVLKRKGLSSKINYEALDALYTPHQETKKNKTESDVNDASTLQEEGSLLTSVPISCPPRVDGNQHDSMDGNANDMEDAEHADEATAYEDAEYVGEYGDDYYGNGGDDENHGYNDENDGCDFF